MCGCQTGAGGEQQLRGGAKEGQDIHPGVPRQACRPSRQRYLWCGLKCGWRTADLPRFLLFSSEPVSVLPEPRKEKPSKLETKPQPKASLRKTSNSSTKKDKNSEPLEEVSSPDKSQPPSRCSQEHKAFQRTLSPADVLHVHSYAKGDYGEGELQSKEEKSESGEIKAERDRRLGKAVSARTRTCPTGSALLSAAAWL